MSPRPSFMVPDSLEWPMELLQLGQFVKQMDDPWRATYPKVDKLVDIPVLESEAKDAQVFVKSINKASLRARISNLFGLELTSTNKAEYTLTGAVVVTKQIQDYEAVFQQLWKDDEVRAELKRWEKAKSGPYMCVGIKTIRDGEVSTTEGKGYLAGSDSEAVGSQGSTGIAGGNTEAVELSAGTSGERKLHTQSKAEGERIFAVRYLAVQSRPWKAVPNLKGAVHKKYVFSGSEESPPTDAQGNEEEAEVDMYVVRDELDAIDFGTDWVALDNTGEEDEDEDEREDDDHDEDADVGERDEDDVLWIVKKDSVPTTSI